MNFILLEDSRYEVGSFIRKVYKKYPSSCRLSLNKSNFSESISLINERPILTDNWLVLISASLSVKQVSQVMSADNLNILILQNKSKLDKFKEMLKDEDINFKIVDNLHPSKNEILLYVVETLHLKLEDAKYLCNRHKYYLPRVINSVYILSTFEHLDRKTIRKYTDRFGTVSLYSIVDSLLGISESPKIRVIELIYNYRYGMDFLLNFIKDKLEQYALIFKYVNDGKLSLDNFTEFEPLDEDDKVYNKISEYELKKIIDTHSKVSNSLLYFIRASVEEIKPKQAEIYKLILLLQ